MKEIRIGHDLGTWMLLKAQHTRNLLVHKSFQERRLGSSPMWHLLIPKPLHSCCFQPKKYILELGCPQNPKGSSVGAGSKG